jgi:hypothetical protein
MSIPFGILIVKRILRATFPDKAYYIIADRPRLWMTDAPGNAHVTMSAMIRPRFMLLNVRACFMIRDNVTISYGVWQLRTN